MKDGKVVVGSWDGFVYFLSPNGKLKAKFETGNMIFSSPAIMNDGTVIIRANNVVYFLNPNGTLKAKFDKNEGITSSPAIMSDGTVVVGSNDGNVYYLDLDPSRIEKKQEKRIVEVPCAK
jgi:outer membrane protein assembly factor BamB